MTTTSASRAAILEAVRVPVTHAELEARVALTELGETWRARSEQAARLRVRREWRIGMPPSKPRKVGP